MSAKSAVDRATTRRVLDDIDATLRPIDRARTAAAVDRVLATSCPDFWSETAAGALATAGLYEELNITRRDRVTEGCDLDCECSDADIDDLVDDATPGMVPGNSLAFDLTIQRKRYAPEVISPHQFGGAS